MARHKKRKIDEEATSSTRAERADPFAHEPHRTADPAAPPDAAPMAPPSEDGGPFFSAATVLIAIYVVFTRLFALDLKPVQHDESMFAYYSWDMFRYWFEEDYTGRAYEFLPILHGPVLQFATAVFYRLFGDSDATMRLFPALCGIGIIVLVWQLRDLMGRRAALFAIVFIALSPTLTYFSRYIRNDIPFLFLATLLIYFGRRYARCHRGVWLLALGVAFGFALCVKETWVIVLFIFATFCLGCWIHGAVKRRPGDQIPFYRSVRFAFLHHWHVLTWAVVLAFLVTVVLFTTFFLFPSHWDGIYEDIHFWAVENKGRRIDGPFHFYVHLLAIYELPFFIFWIACLVRGMWTTRPGSRAALKQTLFWLWLCLSLLTLWIWWDSPLPEFWNSLLHMNMGLHLWMFAQVCLVVGITGWRHLNQGRVFHAFADYWTAASFLSYSYAGEKVPWVTTHIALPLMISCGLYLDLALRRLVEKPPAFIHHWVAVRAAARQNASSRGLGLRGWSSALGIAAAICLGTVGLIWTAWLTTFLVFFNPGDPIERHTYASSHPEFHREIKQVVEEARALPTGRETVIAYQGEPSWPLEWSLRNFPRRSPTVYPGQNAPFVIIDEYKWAEELPWRDEYEWTEVRFRHYWQPQPLDWRAMRRLDLLIRSDETLDPEQRAVAERAATEWSKFFKAMLLRDEDIEGPTRWDYLGGLGAFIGRRKDIDLPDEPVGRDAIVDPGASDADGTDLDPEIERFQGSLGTGWLREDRPPEPLELETNAGTDAATEAGGGVDESNFLWPQPPRAETEY